MTSQLLLALSLLILTEQNIHGTQLISGDATTTTETTSFAIGPTAFAITTIPDMYLGAKDAVANNSYAIARAGRTSTNLQALAPATVNLNGVKDSANPLYGAKINFLKLSNDCPVVVASDGKKVYQFASMTKQKAVATDPDGSEQYLILASNNLKDAAGTLEIGAIIDLEAESDGSHHAFAAVTNNANQDFGNSGSGIALVKQVTQTGKANTFVAQNNGSAIALDNTSSAIKINDDVTLANAVTMHWSHELERLFVGVQATTGGNSSSGARSVLVGKIQTVSGQSYEEIVWEKIAPDAVFTGTDQIIGTVGATQNISALRLRTLITSTRLSYLIVAGGNGSATTTGNLIYALPIVNDGSVNQGHLAKIDAASITETYSTTNKNNTGGIINLITSRKLSGVATSSSDLLTTGDAAAKVGGGALPLAANEQIVELFIVGDCVYASTGDTSSASATGLYQSQAILDNIGFVTNWTKWQKVGGYGDKVYGAGLDQIQGLYWRFTGADATSVRTLSRTQWGSGSADGLLGGTTSNASLGLINQINSNFKNGVYSLTNIPKTNTAALTDINLLIATGYQQISMINPSQAVSGDFGSNAAGSTSDTIPTTASNTTMINIKGDNLSSIGAIVTSNIATNSSNSSWLAIGGSNGVAILRQTNGAGWAAPITNFSALTTSLKFELFGNYKFVKKISSDSDYLYILTDQKLDRIALNNTDLAAGTASTIAQIGMLSGTSTNGCFNDFIVSGDLGILATNIGLYRVANGASIHDVTVDWTTQLVPEPRALNCVKLISITTSGLEEDLINKSNLYVLSTYHGLHQAQINRFYVYNSGTIDNTTIQPLPDLYLKDSNSYFINFESFRDGFFTNGNLLISYLSHDNSQKSFTQILPPGQVSGFKSANLSSLKSYNLPLDTITQSSFIAGIVNDSNSGALLIAGEFGLQVNE